jgi:hypothetical protein
MLLTHYAKALLSNKNLWGWGVLFMAFWLVIGGIVESSQVPAHQPLAALDYTASWYALIALFSLASLGVTISFSLAYSTSSLSYYFRFTRLRPVTYMLDLLVSSTAIGVVLSVIMIVLTYMIFSYRLGGAAAPVAPWAAIGVSALSGVFIYAFSTFLVLLVINNLGLRNQSFMSFMPLVLSYLFGFANLFGTVPTALIYASPFTAIQDLLYHAYSGQPVYPGLANPVNNGPSLQPLYFALSIAAWIALLVVVDAFMLSRIKPRNIEEARQV